MVDVAGAGVVVVVGVGVVVVTVVSGAVLLSKLPAGLSWAAVSSAACSTFSSTQGRKGSSLGALHCEILGATCLQSKHNKKYLMYSVSPRKYLVYALHSPSYINPTPKT